MILLHKPNQGRVKTGCFAIASLELINISDKNAQVIILSPTRELSYQIKSVIDSIGCNMKGFKNSIVSWGDID